MTSISKRNKRTSLHQKYKVLKKVRQHNKKKKQEEKKQKPKKCKPVSIPVDVPFRDDILKSVQTATLQENVMKIKRLKNLNKINKIKKVNELDALKLELSKDPRKYFINEVNKVMESANIMIEVLDARDPIGTRSLEAEKKIKLLNKPLLIVLNKIDLVPVNNLNLWLSHLSKEAKVFPFRSSCQEDDTKFKSEIKIQKKKRPGNVFGADELLGYITSLMNGLDKITVGVIGLPNTGKSSLINSLKKKRVCLVDANPMTTRTLQTIDINGQVKIIDTPGFVLSPENNALEMIAQNCITISNVANPAEKAEYLFDKCSEKQLLGHYYILSKGLSYEKFIVVLAKSLRLFKKGGIPDIVEAGRRMFNDWNSGKLAHCSQPPVGIEEDKCPLSEDQKVIIKKIENKYISNLSGYSIVEGSVPLKTILNVDELPDEGCDDEDCEGCDDEDCEGCDDEDCEGCDDEDCEGCDDEDCDEDNVDMDE